MNVLQLYLAHTTIPGKEHYDYFESIKSKLEECNKQNEDDIDDDDDALLCKVVDNMRGGKEKVLDVEQSFMD